MRKHRSQGRRSRTLALALGSLALLSNACSGPPQTAVGEPELWVEPGIPVVVAEEPPACLQIVRVEVWKQERILRAYCKRGAVVAMDVALGRDESGPKRSAGDQRTPEGRYQTVETARQGRFHLFIPIDYPSREDAAAARAEGRLTELDYQRIMHAHELALLPPHQTPLGGDLGFHGEGERWRGDSRYLNWTYGCIALPDDEIDFLAERLRPGVPVWIHP